MPPTAATGGGIAGGTMTTTTPALALASASASALAPTAVATMAIARRPFNQEVENHGDEQCLMTTTGGGIAGGTMRTTALALASALALALTAVAAMAIARCPFAQDVPDNEPHVTGRLQMMTTSSVVMRACR